MRNGALGPWKFKPMFPTAQESVLPTTRSAGVMDKDT